MRADYNSLIYQYGVFESEIDTIAGDSLGWSQALEADGAPSGSSTGFGGGTVTSSTVPGANVSQKTTTATPSSQLRAQQQKANNVTDASKAAQNTARNDQKNANNNGKNPGKFQEVLQKVREFLQKMKAILDNLSRKLQNRIRICAQTDKGFINLYRKRKAMIKPHESVRVISYQYRNNLLEEPMKKIMGEVTQCLNVLKVTDGATNSNGRISEILQAPQGKMIETLFAPYTKNAKNGPVKSVPEFVRYLVDSYRGEKQEFVYKASQVSEIEKNAMSMGDIRGRCNAYMQAAEASFNQIKSLESQVNRNQTDEKVLQLIAENSRKAATLYNAYSALVSAYFEVRLEQSLNYRVILRKMYEM